jgi:hypothetical protein
MTEKQIEHGFWFWDKSNDFPPDSITFPKEYNGQTKVNIACTQRLELSAIEQKKLIKEWIDFLPTCQNIEMLWFTSHTTQQLFESVCKLKKLVGLNIKWSNIKKLDNISTLTNLKYLNIGSSSQIESITPLSYMTQLEVLRIENFKKITDFSPISALTNLQFFSIEGGMYTKQKVDSFEPFSNLTNLVYFSTAMISCVNKQIDPLLKLKKLKTINWDFDLTAKDMERLKQELPNLKYLPHRYYKSNMEKLKSLLP